MGKSSKKSTKVDAAPAVLAPPTKPLKKGKREAEEAIEKPVATKKQKKDETALKQAITKQKTETKTKKKNQKEESSSSSEEDSSSDSEEEKKVALAAKQPLKKPSDSSSEEDSSSDEDITVKSVAPSKNDVVGKPATKGKVASISSDDSDSDSEDHEKTKSKVPVKNVHVAAATKKNDVSSDDSDDSRSSDDDKSAKVASQAKKSTANAAKNGSVVVTKNKDESGDSLESEEESDEEDETSVKVTSKDAPTKVSAVTFKKGKDNTSDSKSDDDSDEATAPKSAPSKKPSSTTVTKQKVETEEDDSEEESSSESDEEEPDKKKMKVQPNVAKPKQKESSSEEDSSEEESLDEDKNTPKKKDADEEMVDEKSSKTETKEAPQTPRTPQVQETGSKTLFVGSLSFSVEQSDVENFFKDAGEIDGIRFAIDRDGVFKGYGHVEFATVKAAQKALELNGQELLGRRVKLDLARERGAYTPTNGNENSYQKGGRALGQTIFVKGFDTSDGEEKIRSALEEHFGSCGDISRVSIPKDYEGGIKGIAYMDFTDSDGVNKALELNGSEFGESKLTVEEAKLRGDSDRGDGGGRFSNRGHGFNGRSGGRGRFGGGDFGGRFSRGGGRGHGGLKRPSMGTAGTGFLVLLMTSVNLKLCFTVSCKLRTNI